MLNANKFSSNRQKKIIIKINFAINLLQVSKKKDKICIE